MICPECGSANVYIKETRGNDSPVVQRRRLCVDCRLSFWTLEIAYPDLKKPRKTKEEKE